MMNARNPYMPHTLYFLKHCFFLIILLSYSACSEKRSARDAQADQPNIIIIFTDDQGYNDLAAYGAQDIETPHIDKMASEGIRFTDFYDAQPVCSASRAALLTGCYPSRVGIQGALFPHSKIGLNPEEETIAEICKSKGYRTAMVGKWHLGDHPDFMPTKQGFDEFFGLPYSNDMWPFHPNKDFNFPPLPLIENDSIVEYLEGDQSMVTTRLTERAVNFIRANKATPFFLYLAHSMPHVPLFVSSKFKGKSQRGLYGDVIMEIDWSVGRILETLDELALDENTLVIFTSDNGPWLTYGNHAGSAFPLREGKGTVLEGGIRVPCIMRWPGHIPAGVVQRKPAMNIDLLPTICTLIQADLPAKKIDGKSIVPLMMDSTDAESPHEAYYFYYKNNEFQAIRSGKWKLYFPHQYQSLEGMPVGKDGLPGKYKQQSIGLALYDLERDIGETTDVSDQHPETVASLTELATAFRAKLGDRLNGIQGSEVREPGRVQQYETIPVRNKKIMKTPGINSLEFGLKASSPHGEMSFKK